MYCSFVGIVRRSSSLQSNTVDIRGSLYLYLYSVQYLNVPGTKGLKALYDPSDCNSQTRPIALEN